jgi:predicted  nucleic acid-binding Zn-ribbon protein
MTEEYYGTVPSLDDLRQKIEDRRKSVDVFQKALDDLKGDLKEARVKLNNATRDFNVAVSETKSKRKTSKKKVDTGTTFHPEPKQVDLEDAIAREKAVTTAELDGITVYRVPMIS